MNPARRHEARRWTARWAPVLGLMSLAAALGGCGRRIDLPAEPDLGGGTSGEVAYVKKYVWNGMPLLSDLLVTRAQLLYVIEDSSRVRSYFSDAAAARENASRSIPEPVVLGTDTLTRPVQLCEGGGSTIWVAYTRPRAAMVQFDVGGSSPVMTGLRVTDARIGSIGGLAADPDSGFVYVADTDSNTITKYSPSASGGRRVVRLASKGSGDGSVLQPHGIYFFQDSLLVTDTGIISLQVISADVPWPHQGRGQVLVKRRNEQGQLVPEGLDAPQDVWVDARGFFYVADTGGSRVLQLKPDGEVKEIVTQLDPEAALQPMTLAATNTLVWVADPDPGHRRLTIYQINTASEGLP